MKGGASLFRGRARTPAGLEFDRSHADEYYQQAGVSLAEISVVDDADEVIGEGALTPALISPAAIEPGYLRPRSAANQSYFTSCWCSSPPSCSLNG